MTINKLIDFKIIPEECDIRLSGLFLNEAFSNHLSASYIYKSDTINSPKNPKIMKTLIKSTVKSFSADKKSTMNFHKTPETRYQLTSLSQNPKKINIDQL